MEILTDILAIVGWLIFGICLPVLCSYLGGTKGTISMTGDMIVCAIALGFISASLVLW